MNKVRFRWTGAEAGDIVRKLQQNSLRDQSFEEPQSGAIKNSKTVTASYGYQFAELHPVSRCVWSPYGAFADTFGHLLCVRPYDVPFQV